MKHYFAALLMTFVLSIAHAEEKSAVKAKLYAMNVPDFQQKGVVLDESVNHVVQGYHDAIKEIIDQLSHEKLSNEGKVYCAYLLGELRAVEAISVLLDNVCLQAEKVDPKTRIGRWGKYPAQEALIKIGKPAVNMILDRLGKESNEERRKLMCLVLADVEGTEIGKARVVTVLEKAADEIAKRNLELAVKLFE